MCCNIRLRRTDRLVPFTSNNSLQGNTNTKEARTNQNGRIMFKDEEYYPGSEMEKWRLRFSRFSSRDLAKNVKIVKAKKNCQKVIH